jgi:glycosyltransferase involved in cell wall biosynthesis
VAVIVLERWVECCASYWVLPMCWCLSLVTGAALVFNAHELETESIAMRGLKKRVAKVIEENLIVRCAVVSVVNGPIADWYENAYPIDRPIVVGNIPVVRNGPVNLRSQLNIEPCHLLYMHTGNLVAGRNIHLILDCFARSRHHVVFLGDGYLRKAVQSAALQHPNIHWLSPVDPDLIVGLCLIETHLDLSDRLSSPNKLMEALAAGVPPLCSELVMARQLLGKVADQWVLASPASELSAALERITKQDSERFRAAWPGLQSWDEEVQPLLQAYAGLGRVRAAKVIP